MKRHLKLLAVSLVAAFMAVACGDSDRFTVKGTVEGGRSMNLRYVFYDGDAFMQGITAVRGGDFRFEGTAPQPVLIELFDNDYRLLGRIYAAKGDEIECRIDPADPNRLSASGRKDLSRWTQWLRDNADALAAGRGDSLVAAYVERNPGDVVATLLVVTQIDASTDRGLHLADSMLTLIAPEARPLNITRSLVAQIEQHVHGPEARMRDFGVRMRDRGNDTLRMASSPLTLFALSTERTARRDSVVPALRAIYKSHGGRRLRVVDISLDIDTPAWRRITRPDSAGWIQAWLPGGTASRGIGSLAVPSLPYFIVADSTGSQLLRTPSAAAARSFIDKRMARK